MRPTFTLVRRSAFALLSFVAGCRADVRALGAPESIGDARAEDVASDDAGAECVLASECPGPFRECPDLQSCGCGTYKTCQAGRCLSFSSDSCPSPRDAGGPTTCSRSSDCHPAGPTPDFCRLSGTMPGLSCIDRQCLVTCGSSKTCTTSQPGPCLNCDNEPNLTCAMSPCGATAAVTATVEHATCPHFPGTHAPFAGSKVTLVPRGTSACVFDSHRADGTATFGEFVILDDDRWLATIPGLGGTCVGEYAASGALRIEFSCPSCIFVLVL